MSTSYPLTHECWARSCACSFASPKTDILGGAVRAVVQLACVFVRWQGKRLKRRIADYRPDDRLL
ncbi:MAG TPA: hypothetical protein VFA64_18175 [Hyphomicrobiaceae bacterium]|nr:hypothetical protein [Hyphomicrobiaceae bacterium]